MTPPDPFDPIKLARFIATKGIPHNRVIGAEMVSVELNQAVMRLPWKEELVGNPETGWLHGGVITTLIDSAFGLAVFTGLDEIRAIATIDLRLDYIKPAEARRDLFAHATCYRRTRHVAFLRGTAYHDSVDDPVAYAVGTFMIGSSDAPLTRPPAITVPT
ncbi:MAG: PaaI family thioesterase [Alphaproteobacteria bacterium]|nr:PaaI family thioesterase [Alphaproteobacteria bacterium]